MFILINVEIYNLTHLILITKDDPEIKEALPSYPQRDSFPRVWHSGEIQKAYYELSNSGPQR